MYNQLNLNGLVCLLKKKILTYNITKKYFIQVPHQELPINFEIICNLVIISVFEYVIYCIDLFKLLLYRYTLTLLFFLRITTIWSLAYFDYSAYYSSVSSNEHIILLLCITLCIILHQ